MSETLVYDKAKYHLDGDFPKNLPKRQAYIHTGMFVVWLVFNDLLAKQTMIEFKEEIELLKKNTIPPSSLYVAMDGVLSDDLLSEIGNIFAQYYFDFEDGFYLEDYEEILCSEIESFFEVADTWENYSLIATKIDQRYKDWQETRKNPKNKGL